MRTCDILLIIENAFILNCAKMGYERTLKNLQISHMHLNLSKKNNREDPVRGQG